MGKYLNETLGFQGKYLNAGTQSQNTTQQGNSQTQQVQQTQQPVTNSGLVNIRLGSQQRAEVLKKVSIPMYFKEIIIPQLNAEGYYDNYPVNFDNDPRACCPLHDEDTPSFRYYEDTSSFYCFGCQKGGNVINLHRYFAERMNGREVDRDEASAFLYNYFIKGKEQSEFIQSTAKTLDKQEEKSTTVELIKLNAYRSTLERDITFDKTISLEVKEQVWKIFDNVDVLVSKNIISATDAMNYIKQEVNKLV